MDPFVDACKNGDVDAINRLYPLTNKKDQYGRMSTDIKPFVLFKGFLGAVELRRYQVIEALEKRGIEIPGVILPPTFTCSSMDKDEVDNLYNHYNQDWSKMADLDSETFVDFYDSIIVYYEIDSHTILSFRDQEGNTFLFAVVLQENEEILKSLLNSGFDCDQVDLALCLKTACEKENMDIITTLVDYMTIQDLVYSFKTYGKCHDALKQMAHDKFASLVSATPSYWKQFNMDDSDTYYLYKLIGKSILNIFDSAGENLIHYLARSNNTEVFRRIVKQYTIDHADFPNKAGDTPLMIAITNGNYNFVSFIISNSQGKLRKTNEITGKPARSMSYGIKDGQTRLRTQEALKKW